MLSDYQPTCNKDAPEGMLKEFKGHLQTDGYEVYIHFDRNNDIVHLNCMAHTRRYFVNALDSDAQRATYALKQIQQLYAIERSCIEQQLSFNERKAVRQQQCMPILDDLGTWMKRECDPYPNTGQR